MKRFFVNSVSLTLLMFANMCLAQPFVTLPDNNFRDKLIASYPSVMTGNKLNVNAAKFFTNDLILTAANISDLTGIEYFTSVYKIDASFNNLTTIPDISNTTQLKYLFLNFNQIKQIPNLALANLIQLQLANNYLTSLPPLNSLPALDYLFVPNNQLTTLPDISSLGNIRSIIIGNNPFVSLPDFSKNPNLIELHVHQTGISEIKGLAALTKLTKLYCWGNSITDLSALSDNKALNGLYAFNNLLTDLPDLTNKPNLKNVEIANNKLTFEDLLPLSTLGLTDFSYAPQDSIGAYMKEVVRLKHPISLNITEDDTVTSNTYTWYKNATVLTTTATTPLAIPSAAASDAGDYYVKITNTNLPLLTIAHRIWTINVNPACVDLVSYSTTVPYNDCKIGATLETNVVLDGGTAPYTYTLTPPSAKNTIVNTTGDFTELAPGEYAYSIRDANNCGMDTTVTIQKANKCDPVIMPAGDPQMNTYFIEQPGTAKIIDLSGHTIMTLTTPAVWYGTKNDGSLADAGYYVILVNNTKVTNITVIR